MGCQECNSIIMKSDSGELDGWMVPERRRRREEAAAAAAAADDDEHIRAWAPSVSWADRHRWFLKKSQTSQPFFTITHFLCFLSSQQVWHHNSEVLHLANLCISFLKYSYILFFLFLVLFSTFNQAKHPVSVVPAPSSPLGWTLPWQPQERTYPTMKSHIYFFCLSTCLCIDGWATVDLLSFSHTHSHLDEKQQAGWGCCCQESDWKCVVSLSWTQ